MTITEQIHQAVLQGAASALRGGRDERSGLGGIPSGSAMPIAISADHGAHHVCVRVDSGAFGCREVQAATQGRDLAVVVEEALYGGVRLLDDLGDGLRSWEVLLAHAASPSGRR